MANKAAALQALINAGGQDTGLMAILQAVVDQNTRMQEQLTRFATAGSAPGTVIAATPITFASTPGQYQVEELLDYSQKGVKSLYVYSISPLPNHFDIRSGGMVTFLEQLKARALQMGWSFGSMNITS